MATTDDADQPGSTLPSGGNTRRRAALSIALLVLGSLLLALSLITVWVRDQVLDTDRYAENMAPLATDPAVRAAVSSRISDALIDAVDVETIAEDALPGRARVRSGPIARGVEGLIVDVSDRAVQSDGFSVLWREPNRGGHRNLWRSVSAPPGSANTARHFVAPCS